MAGLEIGYALMSRLVLSTVAAVVLTVIAGPAVADPDDVEVDPLDYGTLLVDGGLTIPGGEEPGDGSDQDGSETYTAYDDGPCDNANALLVEKYRRAGVDQPWQLASSGCGASATVGPVVTPDLVLEAVKTVGLPVSSFEVPAKTLVHYETTVYTETTTFERTVTVVGYQVDVRARPSQFTWLFGDGQIRTTTSPGEPYPSDEITHAWLDAHRTFRPRVDTTYAVSYRVDDGPWLDIVEPLLVPGPESHVRVKEATPSLS
jgi:hypothetical protein